MVGSTVAIPGRSSGNRVAWGLRVSPQRMADDGGTEVTSLLGTHNAICAQRDQTADRGPSIYMETGNLESRMSNGERGETVEYRYSLLIDGADLSSGFIPANTLSYGAPAGGVDCREGEDVSGMLSHELSPFHLFTYLYVADLPFEISSDIVVLLRISSEHSAHWTEDIRDGASEL